jgi:hypothetical protein
MWVFAFAVLIITFLLALKRVFERRNQQNAECIEDKSGTQVAEGREVCEKISQE